ncbi:right-handed parallel beta-helix repeat-containing protein, partial [Candidatus Hodarchaeum mangrovi]
NTDVYFIIRYCILTSIDGNYHGIHLSNVVNGWITNNIITDFASAIFLDGSNHINISFNIINAYNEATDTTPSTLGNKIESTGSMSHGIFLDPSDNNTIYYNQISDYTGNGLYILDSSFNNFTFNDINNSYGENGVFLAGSNGNTITYNEIFGNPPLSVGISSGIKAKIQTGSLSHGIFLDPSEENIIAYNNISDFTAYGVYLQNSDLNIVKKNNIDSSDINLEGGSGIFLEDSTENTLTENTLYASDTSSGFDPQGIRFKLLTGSLSHGIFLDPSDKNNITNNYISDFTGNGLYLVDSDNNIIEQNQINNNLDASNSNGVFLEGSHLNIITDNDIFSTIGTSTITSDIRFKISSTGSMSHGIFLDPSNNNTIYNNRISGYDADGLYLLESDFNAIYNNDIDNSIGANGVFLNGSDWNNVSYNNIWGAYSSSNTISSSIRSKILSTGSMSHGIFLDPSNNNTIIGNEIHNITGDGIFAFSSGDNEISYNEIGGNEGTGIFFEDSCDSSICNNVIYNDEIYGILLDTSSSGNFAGDNDLIANNIGGSQIFDDGLENYFLNNFLIDHDNRDSDNDKFSDTPYDIEGSATNSDPYPSALPVQKLDELDLNLANLTAWIDYEAETLNLKNTGNWMNVKIKLPEGYSVTNINVSSVYTDGYPPYNYADIESITYSSDGKLIVKFNRTALIEYLNDILPETPIDIQLNVTGWLNGNFLSFTGSDTVTVLNKDPDTPLGVFFIDQGDDKTEPETSKVLSFVSSPLILLPIAIVALLPKKHRIHIK